MLSNPKAVVKAALEGRLVQWQTVVQARSEGEVCTDTVSEAASWDAPGVKFELLEWSIVDSDTSDFSRGDRDFFVEVSVDGGQDLVDTLRATGLVE